MNRRKKSSIILLIVFSTLSPIIYLAYIKTRQIDREISIIFENSNEVRESKKNILSKNIIGTWHLDSDSTKKWIFISDSILLRDGKVIEIALQHQFIIFNKEEIQLIGIMMNNNTIEIYETENNFDFFFKDKKSIIIKRDEK